MPNAYTNKYEGGLWCDDCVDWGFVHEIEKFSPQPDDRCDDCGKLLGDSNDDEVLNAEIWRAYR
jgi:hypothetical protein